MSADADFAQLAEDLEPEDVRRVLGVFEADVRRLVGQLNAAASGGDVAAFKRLSHGLAGAAGAVGARSLEQVCRTAMGRSDLTAGNLTAAATPIDVLAEAALSELAAFLATLDIPAGRG
jgi:hypothetical protein